MMTKAYKFYYKIFAGFFGFWYNIKVVGKENIPEEDGFLVCANHYSATDPIKISYAFRGHQVHYMAKKELFKIPILKPLIKTLGAFPVDRSRADVGAIKYMLKLLESGESAAMFPQGTRHPEEDPRGTAVKTGAGMISAKTNATVVPVFLHQKNFKHRSFRRATVVIGKPIPFSEFGYDPAVQGEYARISNEIFDRICKVGEEAEFLK